MKTGHEKPVRVPTTKEDVARIMSAVAKEHDGHIPKGHYIAKLQRAETKHAALKQKGAGK
jgi:hypothetical protein